MITFEQYRVCFNHIVISVIEKIGQAWGIVQEGVVTYSQTFFIYFMGLLHGATIWGYYMGLSIIRKIIIITAV